MNRDEEWIANFNDQVEIIQIEVDAFIQNRKLSDYYNISKDADGKTLSLRFLNIHEMPKEIEDALVRAFLRSKPIDG